VDDDEPAQVGYVSVVDYAAVGVRYADADVDDVSHSTHAGLLLEVVHRVVR
jgi:hypothetical protein